MRKMITTAALAFWSIAVFSQSQAFTSTGTFTVPAGVTSVTIEVVGAGGNGGSNGGGGGGGGGYAQGVYAVSPGQVMTVTIGQAGGGQILGGTAVDMLIAASGGTNGTIDQNNIGGGGAGGVGVNGTVANFTGGAGGGATWTYFGGGGGGAAGPNGNGTAGGNTIPWTGQCLYAGGTAGVSGGAPGGDGGKGAGFTDVNCNVTDASAAGLNYGGGGGGGNGNGGPASNGAGGYCLISWTLPCTLDNSVTVSGDTATANETGVNYQWIDCDNNNTPINGATSQQFIATVSGNYAVIVSDNNCSDTSACVALTVPCTLDVTVTVSGDTATSNETNATYQWIDCNNNNTPINGATNASFIATQTGDYAVIVTNNNCSDTSACVAIIITLGNEQISNNANWTVYPNPFTDRIIVGNTTGTEYYTLLNNLGQVVWAGNNIADKNFAGMTTGVYILKIQDGKNTQTISLYKN